MKVLYIGSDKSEAQAVATALRSIDEAVSVLWASQPEHAAKWLNESRDLAALVMDAPSDGAGRAAVLQHVRGLTKPPAVVLIVPDGTAPSLDSLPPGTDSIRRNQFLHRDLPVVVTRALGRTARADLEHQLAEATAALQDAEQRHRAAVDQLAALETQYEIGMARATATWDMVDEQLRTAAGEVEAARQSQAAAAAEVDRLSQLDADLSAQLAEAAEARADLERRLADAERSADAVSTRAEHERLAAAEQLAGRQREFESQIARELDQRQSVEASLAQVISARDDEQKRHALAMTDAARRSRELEVALGRVRQEVQSKTADIEGLTTRETELSSRLEEVNASCHDLERRLAATRAAFEEAGTRATRERLAASKKAAEREAELDGRLQQERTTRVGLEQAVTDAETALRDAQQRHEAALAASAAELAELQATREAIERQLADATIAIREAATRETELDAQLQQERTARVALEQTVADSETALRDARQRHEAAIGEASHELTKLQAMREAIERQLADATTAIREGATRETELDAQLQQERATRAAVEQTVADTETALRDAQQRHEAAIADASHALTELQATREAIERQLADATTTIREAAARETELDAQLQQERATRAALEQTVAGTETALRDAHQRHDAAIADASRELAELQATREGIERQLADATTAIREAAARETELDAQLQQERTARAALEQTNVDTETALRDTQQRHEAALAAAAAELAERQTDFDRELSERAEDRDRLTQRLRETKADLDDLCRAYESASADVERLTQREAELTSQLTGAHTELADRQAHFDRELSLTAAERDRVTQQLRETEVTLAQVQRDYQSAATDLERLTDRATDLIAQLADVQTAHDTLERQLADATAAIRDAAARQTALEEQIQQERASREGLERVLAETRSAAVERESQLEVQLAQKQLEHESRTADMEGIHRTLTAERDQLQQSLAALREESQRLQQALTANVEQLGASRAESHRLFDQAGIAMFRCTRDGALTDINRACATLIGRRALDEPRGIEFAAAVFEDPNVLSWLIERCLTTRTRESVETAWRRQDGSRLFMRLSARPLATDVVEIVAEDLTRLRVLEERRGRAQRMEAVGRLALEVAVTCSSLLNDIQQKGRDWLTTTGVANARHEGERLFDDVGRAAGFMRELAACGDEQARTSTLVDLNTLVRDLEPVLRRVAGGDVEVQLRDTSSPLNVDVGTDRVERLLVNLASYGRGRMPSGGRLRIELGTSVVDRRFTAKHPNVRLGLHALITVTEVRRPAGSDEGRARSAGRHGVDFGTLQELVSECGGHLWMSVQPPGDMVAKIRLPLSIADDQPLPRAASRAARGRTAAARWFQS